VNEDLDDLEAAWLDLAWPEYFIQNLVVAGALCASFAFGEYLERGKWAGGWRGANPWSPGCQKPVEF
jgi:hypothetical protein